jgi:hypothetical protein
MEAILFRFAAIAAAGAALVLMATGALAATSYSQGFETNTFDWTGATRVASGTNGVPSADGSWHAEVADGAFTRFGGYESAFPAGGYTTSIDIYLDMSENTVLGTDKRFDYSSAINRPDGMHRRDFIFSVGTDPLVTGQFAISASNNSPGWPSNPARDPVFVDETGWYTFSHTFQDDGSGVLEVIMEVRDSNGALLNSWTLSDPTDLIGITVGGHRYGWFVPVRTLADVAIDNVSLVSVNEPEDKDDCKKGGWQDMTRADGSAFKNQGDCIQYVNTGK